MSPRAEQSSLRESIIAELRRKSYGANWGWSRSGPICFRERWRRTCDSAPAQRGETLSDVALAALLERVGLKDYATRNVANLSGGEAQRVSVARTLANSPLVLLLDEPTSALDETAKLGVEALLQEIVRDHKLTCVMVTHDVAQAARLAERALVMDAGRIVREGAIREVLGA